MGIAISYGKGKFKESLSFPSHSVNQTRPKSNMLNEETRKKFSTSENSQVFMVGNRGKSKRIGPICHGRCVNCLFQDKIQWKVSTLWHIWPHEENCNKLNMRRKKGKMATPIKGGKTRVALSLPYHMRNVRFFVLKVNAYMSMIFWVACVIDSGPCHFTHGVLHYIQRWWPWDCEDGQWRLHHDHRNLRYLFWDQSSLCWKMLDMLLVYVLICCQPVCLTDKEVIESGGQRITHGG